MFSEIRKINAISKLMLLGLSIVVATSASAFNRLDAIEAVESVRTNWNDAGLELWINNFRGIADPGVNIGDSVTFSIESQIPGHYLLTLIDSKGETTLFLSEPNQVTNRYDFPNFGDGAILEQGPPLGEQFIFVFASESEFNLSELGMTSERILTLPTNTSALQKLASVLNNHGDINTLARADRYTYAVDDPALTLSTRGLQRKLRPVMSEPGAPPPVVVAQPEPEVSSVSTPDVSSTTDISALSLDIKFRYNSAELEGAGIAQLEVLGSALVNYLEAGDLPVISLEGHTDDSGPEDYNMDLSNRRANATRAFLVDNFGLPASSIEAYGMGEERPIAPNTDAASRAINRRVELRRKVEQ